MRHMNVTAGDIVAVQGLGCLGHLAIQYARKMGVRVVALSCGTSKKDYAMKLGATDYIDTEAHSVAEELQKMGGAAMIAVTARTRTSSCPCAAPRLESSTLTFATRIPKKASIIRRATDSRDEAMVRSVQCDS
jgi:D-arabinose 1-dehydrogenase-like Zn-dependent alcohol dehydrogenase